MVPMITLVETSIIYEICVMYLCMFLLITQLLTEKRDRYEATEM